MLHGIFLAFAGYAGLYASCFALGRLLARRVESRGRVMRIRFRAWLPRVIRVRGVAVFGVIWLADDWASPELIAHEWRHIEQERAHAFLGYLPMYFLRFAIARSYLQHPMEIDARAFAAEHWRGFPEVRRAGRHG
jgi:hypothetical protein